MIINNIYIYILSYIYNTYSLHGGAASRRTEKKKQAFPMIFWCHSMSIRIMVVGVCIPTSLRTEMQEWWSGWLQPWVFVMVWLQHQQWILMLLMVFSMGFRKFFHSMTAWRFFLTVVASKTSFSLVIGMLTHLICYAFCWQIWWLIHSGDWVGRSNMGERV